MLIFDNATGVGKRIGDKIYESKLFGAFRSHYNFRVHFCNPKRGNSNGIYTTFDSAFLYKIEHICDLYDTNSNTKPQLEVKILNLCWDCSRSKHLFQL